MVNSQCTEIKSFGMKSPLGPKIPFHQIQLKKFSFNSIPDNFALYWLGHSSIIIGINHKELLLIQY